MASRRRAGPLLAVLFLVVALVGAGWFFRDRIPGLGGGREELTSVSPQTAEQAEAKLAQLNEGEEVRLSESELTSLLRYRLGDRLPADVETPEVRMNGDTVRLSGRFPTDRLPPSMDMGAARDFLPDTADVEVRGTLRSLASGRAAVKVDVVTFARVPVPQQFYPDALARLGRRDEPGLAPTEYPVRLPPGVGAARVEGGQLVLSPGK